MKFDIVWLIQQYGELREPAGSSEKMDDTSILYLEFDIDGKIIRVEQRGKSLHIHTEFSTVIKARKINHIEITQEL